MLEVTNENVGVDVSVCTGTDVWLGAKVDTLVDVNVGTDVWVDTDTGVNIGVVDEDEDDSCDRCC